MPLDSVVDDETPTMHVHDALTLPAARRAVVANLTMAIDASGVGSRASPREVVREASADESVSS
jgi:hypothetical protein